MQNDQNAGSSQQIEQLKKFLEMSLEAIATATGTDRARWSKYFSGTPILDSTLDSFAVQLGMPKYLLLLGIDLRRKKQRVLPAEAELMIICLAPKANKDQNCISEQVLIAA
jgi:hypothetical protein